MVVQGIRLNLYVGSKIGTFKHVRYDQNSKKKRKDTSRHLRDVKSLQKGEGISCLAFRDPEQTEVVLARDNRTLEVYSLLTEQLTYKADIEFGKGRLHSVAVYEDAIMGAVESGIVRVWKSKLSDGFEINAGENLERMVHCPYNKNIIGTGGKENELKLWDLEQQKMVFEAKNVPHDWLQLRVPVWVSDLTFLPHEGGQLVAMCSRYGVVRLYDARAQRRPVCSVDFPGQANTCITTGVTDKQVLVGNGRGFLQMVDLRAKGRPDRSFKGSAGALTQALVLPESGLVVSASLDRHLRIHDYATKDLIHKQYMTSKLSCFLVRTSSNPLPGDADEIKAELKEEGEGLGEGEEKGEGGVEDADPEYEQLFENMEVIREESTGKKKKHKKIENISIKECLDTPSVDKKKKKRKNVEESSANIEEQTKTPKKSKNSEESLTESVPEILQGECDITNKLKKLRDISQLESGTPKKAKKNKEILESIEEINTPRQLRKSLHIIPESELRSAKKDKKTKDLTLLDTVTPKKTEEVVQELLEESGKSAKKVKKTEEIAPESFEECNKSAKKMKKTEEIAPESFEECNKSAKKMKKTKENQLESVTPKKVNKILDIASESIDDSCSSAKKAKKSKEISQSVEECVTPMKTRNAKRLEGETATPDLDESIKKLLRSTEKTKRKLEKQKLEKKRKSVFNDN